MAGMYYENVPVAITVANGASKVLALDYPNRVRLTKLNITQQGSSGYVTFKVDVYNHVVTDVPSTDLSDYKWLVSDPAQLSSDAPGRLDYKFKDYDVFFFNQDSDAGTSNEVTAHNVVQPSTKRVSALKRYTIYIRITNTGGTPATFDVVLGSESPHEL